MAGRWLRYDTARVRHLHRQLIVATDELVTLAAGAPTDSDVSAVVGTIVDGLRSNWISLVGRIADDTSLTAWIAFGEFSRVDLPAPVPPACDAAVVARWWAALSPAEQSTVIAETPARVGNLDGVPAWARDRANRQLLATDLERLGAPETAGMLTDEEATVLANARAVSVALADAATFVDPRTDAPAPVQLYLYEPAALGGDGRAAVVLGDLDTARHIALVVPGMGTEVARIGMAVPEVVYAEASAYTSDGIAAVAWVGYDAPSISVVDGSDRNPVDDAADWVDEAGDLAHVVTLGLATRGAAALAADITGVRAMHGDERVHLTVIGNSYGSTTVAIAADEFALDADDVVLTGSPGAGRADNAADLTTGTSNTWVGSASDDPVSQLGRTGGAELHDLVELFGVPDVGLGYDPAEDDFGARRFQAEWSGRNADAPWSLAGHGHYFDRCAEAPASIGAIVAGEYEAVRLADYRHKDESWDLGDPLGDLRASDPEAGEQVEDCRQPATISRSVGDAPGAVGSDQV